MCVSRHQEEGAGREGVAGAAHHDRRREGEDALGQGRTEPEQGDDVLVRSAEGLQIESGGEATGPPFQQDGRVVAFSLVEGFVQAAQHGNREDVDLAVVHRDGADRAVVGVGDEVCHGSSGTVWTAILNQCFETMFLNGATAVNS
jgi:hypothetical protein